MKSKFSQCILYKFPMDHGTSFDKVKSVSIDAGFHPIVFLGCIFFWIGNPCHHPPLEGLQVFFVLFLCLSGKPASRKNSCVSSTRHVSPIQNISLLSSFIKLASSPVFLQTNGPRVRDDIMSCIAFCQDLMDLCWATYFHSVPLCLVLQQIFLCKSHASGPHDAFNGSFMTALLCHVQCREPQIDPEGS